MWWGTESLGCYFSVIFILRRYVKHPNSFDIAKGRSKKKYDIPANCQTKCHGDWSGIMGLVSLRAQQLRRPGAH